MGQYYNPTSLNNLENLYSHSYGNGLKLMEHSWIGNNFVGAVETLLAAGGRWYKHEIVWAGDYEPDEVDAGANLFILGTKLEEHVRSSDFRFVVNHTAKRFVDKYRSIKLSSEWRIHPLPLLTCEGNGGGGGDFRGDDPRGLIGSWARHSISVADVAPEGFQEIIFDLTE